MDSLTIPLLPPQWNVEVLAIAQDMEERVDKNPGNHHRHLGGYVGEAQGLP